MIGWKKVPAEVNSTEYVWTWDCDWFLEGGVSSWILEAALWSDKEVAIFKIELLYTQILDVFLSVKWP